MRQLGRKVVFAIPSGGMSISRIKAGKTQGRAPLAVK
jgi:hypothetical protein